MYEALGAIPAPRENKNKPDVGDMVITQRSGGPKRRTEKCSRLPWAMIVHCSSVMECHRPAVEYYRPAIMYYRPAMEYYRPAIEYYRSVMECYRPAMEYYRLVIVPQKQER